MRRCVTDIDNEPSIPPSDVALLLAQPAASYRVKSDAYHGVGPSLGKVGFINISIPCFITHTLSRWVIEYVQCDPLLCSKLTGLLATTSSRSAGLRLVQSAALRRPSSPLSPSDRSEGDSTRASSGLMLSLSCESHVLSLRGFADAVA